MCKLVERTRDRLYQASCLHAVTQTHIAAL